MSASHMLAGMYPPRNEQIWNNSLLWQAIPIHTMPGESDNVLAMKRPCALYDKAYKEYQQSNEVLSTKNSNRTLLKYLEGNAHQTITDFCDVKTIYHALWVENLKNFPLPKWTNEVFYEGSDMFKLTISCFQSFTSTRQLARLRIGFLLHEILNRFTEKKNGVLRPDRSLWIYSAHDTTMMDVSIRYELNN